MATSVTPEAGEAAAAEVVEPQVGAIEAALAAARGRMAGGESAFKPPEEKPAEEKPAEEAAAAAAEGEGEGEGEAAAEEGAGDGKAEGAEAEGAAEGEAEGAEAQAGEGEGEQAAAEGDEEGAGAEAEVDEKLVVGLPGRREGEEEVEIVAENEEVAERLRQLKNAAIEGDRIVARETQISADQKQIEELEVWIGTDPTGFILANVPAAVVDEVTMSLLTHPEVWGRIADQVRALDDPAELRVITAELKAKRAESQNTLRKAVDDRRYAREQGKIIRDSIGKMVPVTDGITETRREAIIGTLQDSAAKLIREKNLEKIEPADLVLLLAPTLRAQGIEPMAAAAAVNGKAATEKPAPKRTSAKRKQPTKAELKSASDKRSKAAVSASPGASAPAARTKLPKGARVEDALKLAREKGIAALRP